MDLWKKVSVSHKKDLLKIHGNSAHWQGAEFGLWSLAVWFQTGRLPYRALMVKLLQNLQDVYSKWEAKSKPRISRSADESTTRQWTGTLDTLDGSKPRPQKGGKLLPRRNLAFNPGRHGTDKVRVPTLGHVQRSKVSFVDEVRVLWFFWGTRDCGVPLSLRKARQVLGRLLQRLGKVKPPP